MCSARRLAQLLCEVAITSSHSGFVRTSLTIVCFSWQHILFLLKASSHKSRSFNTFHLNGFSLPLHRFQLFKKSWYLELFFPLLYIYSFQPRNISHFLCILLIVSIWTHFSLYVLTSMHSGLYPGSAIYRGEKGCLSRADHIKLQVSLAPRRFFIVWQLGEWAPQTFTLLPFKRKSITLQNKPSIVRHLWNKITLPFTERGNRDNCLLVPCATSKHSGLGLDLSNVFQITVSNTSFSRYWLRAYSH